MIIIIIIVIIMIIIIKIIIIIIITIIIIMIIDGEWRCPHQLYHIYVLALVYFNFPAEFMLGG